MNNVKFAYVHEKRRHLTLARTVDPVGKVVRFGWAVCHPGDPFEKRLGRIKAEGRLKSSNFCEAPLKDGESPLATAMNFLASASSSEVNAVPTAVRKMAQQWLKSKAPRPHQLPWEVGS